MTGDNAFLQEYRIVPVKGVISHRVFACTVIQELEEAICQHCAQFTGNKSLINTPSIILFFHQIGIIRLGFDCMKFLGIVAQRV